MTTSTQKQTRTNSKLSKNLHLKNMTKPWPFYLRRQQFIATKWFALVKYMKEETLLFPKKILKVTSI